MNIKALAATALAVLALTGCTQAAPAAPPEPTPSNIYRAVHDRWEGDNAPDKDWIDDAATLVCKQIIGGIEPRVVPDHAHNNEVVVTAAERYVCEVDR
jgi:hypothetical protein